MTEARIQGLVRELADSGLLVLADKGYAGASARIRTRTRTMTVKAHRAEGRQPRSRPAARPRRTRQRPAAVLGVPWLVKRACTWLWDRPLRRVVCA